MVSSNAAPKRSLKKNVKHVEHGGPSKPLSGYFLFGNEIREKVTEEYRASLKADEKFQIQAVAKILGEKWKALTAEQQEKYNSQGHAAKEQYDKDMEAWKATPDYEEFVKESAKHKLKISQDKARKDAKGSDSNPMPKRPLTGYMIFSAEAQPKVREEFAAAGKPALMADVTKVITPRWAALGPEGQKPYSDRYQEAKKVYEVQMEEWKKSEEGLAYYSTLAKSKKLADKKLNPNKRQRKSESTDGSKKAKKDGESEEGTNEENEEGTNEE